MPDNKDIAVLAKKIYELSVLPAEALEARKWEALLILNAVYSSATPEGSTRLMPIRWPAGAPRSSRRASFPGCIQSCTCAPTTASHRPPATPSSGRRAEENPPRRTRPARESGTRHDPRPNPHASRPWGRPPRRGWHGALALRASPPGLRRCSPSSAVRSSLWATPTQAHTPGWCGPTTAATCASTSTAAPNAGSCKPPTWLRDPSLGSPTTRPSSSSPASSSTSRTRSQRSVNYRGWLDRPETCSSYSWNRGA